MLYREGQIIGVSRIQWDPRGTDEDPKCLFSDHKKNRIEIRPLYEIKKGIFIFQIGRHKNHNLKPKFVDFGLNFVQDETIFPLLQAKNQRIRPDPDPDPDPHLPRGSLGLPNRTTTPATAGTPLGPPKFKGY